MIHFDNFSAAYPSASQPVLQRVNLHIQAGAFALVVGPSGSGKSTLLRSINGLVPYFTGGLISGHVRVAGYDPITLGPQQMSAHVGFVFQDPDAQFVMDRVEDEIAFTLENAALPRTEMRVRLEESLDLLELAALRRRRLDTLSGGQKQRVAIASALALRPRVLVLDEPTSQLDPKSAEDVLHALLRLNHDLGLTVVLSEHRLERVATFADQVILLSENRSAPISGEPRELLATAALAPPVVRLARHFGWMPTPLSVKEGRAPAARMPHTNQRQRPLAHPGVTLLEIRGVDAGYENMRALQDASLQLRRGEIVVALGRNGSGKSTLLKSIIGLVRPTRGHIFFNSREITAAPVAEIAQHIAYVPQDPNTLLFADSVEEELRITLHNHNMPESSAHIAETLAAFGLSALAHAYPRDLSAGERQRVALAALCVTQPQVLLLDEPTHGLDYAAKANLVRLLLRWRDDGASVLLVTHDVEFAAALADRAILMSEGRILSDGPPSSLLAHSPLFATQTARLFPDSGWLTAEDAIGNAAP